jgi:hypothetical protein
MFVFGLPPWSINQIAASQRRSIKLIVALKPTETRI